MAVAAAEKTVLAGTAAVFGAVTTVVRVGAAAVEVFGTTAVAGMVVTDVVDPARGQ